MATVIQVEDANAENIFIELNKTFYTNFLLLKWKNETNVYVILNLLEVLGYSIKEFFYEVSSDYFVKHRTQFSVFLRLDTHTFVCHEDKLYKMVKLLHTMISKHKYLTAFMRFNRDSLSFKTEKRNKNDEKCQLFAAKLFNEMQCCKYLCDMEKDITDKSVCSIDSTNRKNKRSLIFKRDDSPYTPVSQKSCKKRKTLPPRSKVDKTRKSEDSRDCGNVDVKNMDSQPFDVPAVSGAPLLLEYTPTRLLSFGPRINDLPTVPVHQDNGSTEIVANIVRRDIQAISHDVTCSFVSHKSCNKIKALSPCSVVDKTGKSEDSRDCGNVDVENMNSQPYDLPAYPGASPLLNHTPNQSLPIGPRTNDLPTVPLHQDNGSSEIVENIGRIDTQASSHNGTSSNILASNVLQNDSRSEICIDGSSYNRTGQFHSSGVNIDLPPPAVLQQNTTIPMGHLVSSTSGQQQQYQQHNRETTFSEVARRVAIPREQNGNDLVRVLGRVRSPEYADSIVRLSTFTRWPSDIAQTAAQVADAGFYYAGFQDTVRCFACDGGLKNWDPDDDPWIEHARWFPQCAFVRHIKGEEFINLVRMSTEESDEEDDYTVHAGATWGGAKNSNTSADSASHEITEPSVVENKDAQFVIEMGFSKRDVAMAINDILKKGKEDFTSQEIADIILEKDTVGEKSNSMLAVDCPPTFENVSPTDQAMFDNKRLKELLQCTECKSKQRNILFLPCTHHVVCELCSRDLHICTYCYRKIKDKVRTYMS